MVNSIFDSFHNKQNPFRTPVFKVQCQEVDSSSNVPTTVQRKISAASVAGTSHKELVSTPIMI